MRFKSFSQDNARKQNEFARSIAISNVYTPGGRANINSSRNFFYFVAKKLKATSGARNAIAQAKTTHL